MKKPRRFPIIFSTALFVMSLGSMVAAAEPAATPELRAHFKAGIELLKSRRNLEALREFKAAYAIAPRLSVLYNIGVASERLERDGDALDAFQEYLDRGGAEIDALEAAEIRQRIERLRSGIATVTIEAPGSFSLMDARVDAGSRVANHYGPFQDRAELRVRSGQHEFALEQASFTAPAWTVPLLARDTTSYSFAPHQESEIIAELEPVDTRAEEDEPPPEASHTASYVLWGTGTAGALATTILLFEAHRQQNAADDDFARNCPLGATGTAGCENSTPASERAAKWRTGALLTGIGALGALVGGTVLYFLDDQSSSAAVAAEATVKPWVSPKGIGISGTF